MIDWIALADKYDGLYDVITDITQQCLIDCYNTNEAFQEENDYAKTKKALKRSIRYVSNPTQWKEFEDALQ